MFQRLAVVRVDLGELDMRGDREPAAGGRADELGERLRELVEPEHRVVRALHRGAAHVRQVRLRIEVDRQRIEAAARQRRRDVERGRGLADPALLVEYGDFRHATAPEADPTYGGRRLSIN
jgi:hypothetical protein